MNGSGKTSEIRWKATAIGLTLLLIGTLIWDYSDRRAADATQPIPHASPATVLDELPASLKIASFNIHGGKGSDGIRNLPRIADLLSDVDIAGLYEVRSTPFEHDINQAAAIGQTSGSGWLFAATERRWGSDHFGNGLIHQLPLGTTLRIPLLNTRGKAYRNAILTTAKLRKSGVRIIAVHIDRENDRRHQLQAVVDLFLGLQPPCVLMGDLNSTQDDPILQKLREEPDVESPLHTATEVARLSSNIDWIFTRGLKTISAKLIENVASDHPVIKAELEPIESP